MRIARIALLLAALSGFGVCLAWQAAPRPVSAPPSAAAAPNRYIDPARCATCHIDIAPTYALTGMGRSFAAVTAASLKIKLPSQPYFHAPSQTYYTIVEHGDAVYQRRWQIGYDGQPANVEELRIDYVLGSGNHAITFLHLTAQHTLEELPFAWYSENGGTWAMNPGYDRPDNAGSTRVIQADCMFCHNGYPLDANGQPQKMPDAAESVFQLPLPQGIDCQRCHGPGERHVETVMRKGATLQQMRASIVNPARLGPQREMEVCLQCHLEPSSLQLPEALLRAGRDRFSYRPGQPLADYRLSFDRAPGKNTRFELNSSAYRLMQSQCFIQTQSWAPDQRLQCTTCHDPHNIPRGQAADQHYNAVCATCHAPGQKAALTVAGHPSNPDCISCHMPKRRTDDGIHMVMTDHLIQRRPPANLLAPKTEYFESSLTSYKGVVVPFYPAQLAPTEQNLLDVAAAQVKEDSNLKQGIPELTALIAKYHPPQADYYTDLADAWHDAGTPAQSTAMYEAALRHDPGSAIILLRLGHAQMDWKQWANAEATLRQVTLKTPSDPVPWALLGQALFQQGKDAEAEQALEKAVVLDPTAPEPYNYLGAIRLRADDAAGAETEFRKAILLLPNVAAWQANLAAVLASEGKDQEAGYLFQFSLRLDANDADAHLNYARLLASENQNAAAETQAAAAVHGDPNNAAARDLWGYLLMARGDLADALPQLKTAVRLQPTPWRANFDLAMALRQTGDAAGAAAQLRIAAQADDPQLRAAAQQMLQAQPSR